jgi:hypothetical protein
MSRIRSSQGVVSLVLVATAWLLVALWLLPWLRDFMAAGFVSGGHPRVGDAWPPPAPILAGAVMACVMACAGTVLFTLWSGKQGGLGRMVDDRLPSPGRLATAVAVWAAVLSAAMLAGGDPTIGDAKTHVSRAWIWQESMRGGAVPVWTDLWYGGCLTGMYPPLSHVLVALVGLLGVPTLLATKLVVWLASIAGAVGFSIWCRSFYRSTRCGVLGGIVYSLLPTIDATWMWQGRLPGVVIMGVLPWAFIAMHKLATRAGGRRAVAGLALCVAAIVLSHTLQARLALAMLAAYAVAEFAARRGARIGGLLLGGCGGLAISLCFLVPVYLERGDVNDFASARDAVFHTTPPVAQLLERSVQWSSRGDWYPGLTVVALMVLGVWGLVHAARRGGQPRRVVWAVLAVTVVPWVFVTWQESDQVLLYAGVALAAAASAVWAGTGKRSHLLLVAVLMLLVDLGPANLISTYVTHRSAKEEVYATLEARQNEGSYLELPLSPRGVPRSSYWHYVPSRAVASVSGPFIQGAPPSFVYRAAMIDTVAGSFANGRRLDDRLVRYLALQNVGWIALSTPTTLTPPSMQTPPGVELDSTVPAWRVASASPLAMIDALPEASLPSYPVKSQGIAAEGPAGRPFSREVISAALAWMDLAKPTPVTGVELTRRPNAVDLAVPDVGERTLRIAFAATPQIAVHIDEIPVEWRQGPLGGILVDIAPGPHRVSIEGKATTIRATLSLLLVALAALSIVLAVVPVRWRSDAPGGGAASTKSV